MVPFEAFWMSSPQSSIAFCNGCDGGTQCDSFSSKVLSCAEAVPRLSASPSAARPQSFKWRVPSIGVSPCDLVANRTVPFNRRTAGLYIFTLPCRGGSIPRIVLDEIGSKILQDRIRIVAGLLHCVGPRLYHRHGCRFPQIELRVR